MARSYFNRLVHGGDAPRLEPLRPISNLWKTAQIDAAAESPSAKPFPVPARASFPQRSAKEPVKPPASMRPSAPIGPPKASLVAPMQPAFASANTQANPAARVEAVSPHSRPSSTVPRRRDRNDFSETPHKRPEQSNPTHTAPEVESPPQPSVTWVPPSREFSVQSSATERHAALPPAIPKDAPPSRTPEPILSTARPSEMAPPSPDHAGTQAPAAAPAPAVARPATSPLPVAPAPMAPVATPIHHPHVEAVLANWFREPSRTTRPNATPTEAPSQANTVQIGKIEVQVISPPQPSPRSAPPLPPTARLARGYALWPGW